MSKVLTWMKSNVVIVACIVVMIAAMASLVWPTGAANAAFQAELDARPQQLRAINDAINRRVTIPAEDPNAQPISVNMTVNDAAVKRLKDIFQQMNLSYDALFTGAMKFNQVGAAQNNPHKPMIEGLFGVLPPDDVKRINSVTAYNAVLDALYKQPSLRSGSPPTAAELANRLTTVERNFAAVYLGAAGNNGGSNDPALIRQKAEAQRDLLVSRAASIGIYMDPPQVASTSSTPGSSSFQITTLATMSQKPDMALIWESQMQLWIQQDLLAAVALANSSAGPSASVLQNPVKRVIAMTIKPGYVGVSSTAAGATGPGQSRQQQSTPDDISKRLPDNFTVSPTGRRSNPLYDVRMATLSVIIDARRIPVLLNAICQTNFMTPIIDKISSVDQLDQLVKAGYFFGDNVDVVQLDLTVETLWLRRWTAGQTDDGAIEAYKLADPNNANFAQLSHDEQVKYLKQNNQYDLGLMPDEIRYELGLPTRNPDFKPAGSVTPDNNGMSPEFMGPDFGGPGFPGGPGIPGGRPNR